jgi:peroxiredoxin
VAIDAFGVRHAGGGIEGDIARPAVFLIDREGRIVWRELTENWRVRVRPETVLEHLAAIP